MGPSRGVEGPLTRLSFQMIESNDISGEKIRMKEAVEGLQDKLNKRDKEVTALTSQTEMLRAQVSGKSPHRRADAGLSLPGQHRAGGTRSGCPP